jgi:uncharacterized protein YigA (DUF484 family)
MELTINLKPSLLQRLEQRKQELKTNTDALINKALEDFFYFERLNALRQNLKNQAQEQGFQTEEDIFNAIS